jgi:hypothetical protein
MLRTTSLSEDDLFSVAAKPPQPPAETAPSQKPGLVGFDEAGRFFHYCACGEWGSFGYGVLLREDRLGTWYCAAHRPPKADR